MTFSSRLASLWRRTRPDAPIAIETIEARLRNAQAELEAHLAQHGRPRIALVKQDVCEDLYCGPRSTCAREIVASTQLRSGPVALFSRLGATFFIVKTAGDAECGTWKERATALHWDSLDFFAGYRDRIPGRDHGQKEYASAPEDVDWSEFDVVISVDVAVPARVTRQFPNTCFAYYVREVKAPAYSHGLEAPADGQQLFLNHGFHWTRPEDLRPHVIEFPYHLQYVGCFHEVFDVPFDAPRRGVFVDHHTLLTLDAGQRQRLEPYGPVAGPEQPPGLEHENGKAVPPRRTMDPDLRERLLRSKYFLVTPGKRQIFGTAIVEAIAAGCLAIGCPEWVATNGFLFSPAVAASDFEAGLRVISRMEADPDLYHRELSRQRHLIDYLCYTRPVLELLQKSHEAREGGVVTARDAV